MTVSFEVIMGLVTEECSILVLQVLCIHTHIDIHITQIHMYILRFCVCLCVCEREGKSEEMSREQYLENLNFILAELKRSKCESYYDNHTNIV